MWGSCVVRGAAKPWPGDCGLVATVARVELRNGGQHVVDAALAAGVDTLFTLSGAHIFPVYDAAVGGKAAVQAAGDPLSAQAAGPLRLVDTRHEQTAAFAAEAVGKLTRRPGFAAVTAGPGVTNVVSAMTNAHLNGSPMVVLGGRSPDARWGLGALQELDHPPILAPVTKAAWTVHDPTLIRAETQRAFDLAASPRRGPVFLDIPMDVLFGASRPDPVVSAPEPPAEPDPDAVSAALELLAASAHPVLVLGGGVWMGDAVAQARELVAARNLPVISNGMGRGVIPPSDEHLVTRARAAAFGGADLVIVVGTPLDFRLGFGKFGSAKVLHLVESADAASSPADLTLAGDLRESLAALAAGPAADAAWVGGLRDRARAAVAADQPLLASESDLIHPARIYGELLPRLTADTTVIGDGGDFVSFAGRFIEPEQPGRWLDPGPYGCLGTGPGYALAAGLTHPGSPVVLLLGDGAAGFSLMDVDTLVRHRIPVAIVMGNNAAWGLEKESMQMLYGYDVIADLAPTAYDQVATALGGAGETVTEAAKIGPALDRALEAGVPYLVNIQTDPGAGYPRSTLLA